MLCAVYAGSPAPQSNQHDAAAVVDTVAELIKRRQERTMGCFLNHRRHTQNHRRHENTTVKTQDNTFASTSPISNPILNFIKHRTINPTIVVRLLAKMEFNASLIALLNAVI